MFIRTLTILGVLAAATTARADVGVGLFVGEPSGLDVKIGLQRSSAIDLVFGWETIRRGGRDPYAHLTYLLTPFYGTGRSVVVPLRLGIGSPCSIRAAGSATTSTSPSAHRSRSR
jgi:hypothetical protein